MPAPQALLSPERHATDGQFSAEDLSAIRLLALPDVGPPFDDDPAVRTEASAIAGTGGTAAMTAGPAAEALDPGPGAGAAARAADPGVRAAAGGGTDDEWARQFARLLAEALAGARPVRQIQPWTSERARVHAQTLTPLFDGGHRPRVLRVITTRPAPDVIEMTAVVGVGGRTRALALRLERPGPAQRATRKTAVPAPRWLCTAIEAA